MFFKDVYEVVKQIPEGRVTTYGAIAEYLNSPGSSLVVGWALHANKEGSGIPCHRVVNKEGGLAKGFAFDGPRIQKLMLEEEGIIVNTLKDKKGVKYRVDLEKYFWDPSDMLKNSQISFHI